MQLSQFDYHLPEELVAQQPAEPRDSARLLVYDRATQAITHDTVANMGVHLPPSTLIVANNSRVRNSRLYGRNSNRKVEALVLEKVAPATYRCLIGGKAKAGDNLSFFSDNHGPEPYLTGTVTAVEPNPAMTTFLISFEAKTGERDLEKVFEQFGTTPLPPYITETTAEDERYQTVYSKEVGSAAAPTAGLHFTPHLIESLKKAGHQWREATLHVGIGTFLPLRNEHIEANRLHTEASYIDSTLAADLTRARRSYAPIMTVGTTATRALEFHSQREETKAGWQSTDIFIYPGYIFRASTILLTNFHLPKSSLLLLVAAFLGNDPEKRALALTEAEMIETLHQIYAEAIKQEYRFYSFGDALLIK